MNTSAAIAAMSTGHTLLAMLTIAIALAALYGALMLLRQRAHPELVRKLLHVGIGLIVLSFPALFDRNWPVLVLAGGTALLLLYVKLRPALRDSIGGVIDGVHRPSLGEIYYPIAIGTLWVLSHGQWILFIIPMLVLTLADALAALVGVGWGKVRYSTTDGSKSIEGSLAFFLVAFLSVHVPLLLFTDVGRAETLLIAVIIGLLVMLMEAIAWRGLDNLFVPLGTFALLSLYIDKTPHELLIRVAATMALVVFVFAWRARTSLDDSALIASAFFGYLAWMLGGVLWLLPPMALFLTHCMIWPRGPAGRCHSVRSILAKTSAGLRCLLALVATHRTWLILPFAVSFAAHLAMTGISSGRVRALHPTPKRLTGFVVYGWLVGFVPVLLIAYRAEPIATLLALAIISLASVAVCAIIYHRLSRFLFHPEPGPLLIDLTTGALGVLGSIVVAISAMYLLP
jgi:phytol kinase